MSPSHYCLRLPGKWVSSSDLARAMSGAGNPHDAQVEVVEVIFSSNCRLLTDAITQLLSLLNQLAQVGREVVLRFEDGLGGVMRYLYRLGFFDFLHPSVRSVPPRPKNSAIALWGGNNANLVELKRICPRNRDKTTPTVLADALEAACEDRPDRSKLGIAAYTVFGELIDNIYEHSNTQVDGYAALQVYRGSDKVLVSVSDSGYGLLETLRPSLAGTSNEALSNSDLIVRMLNDGLSRLEKESPERGAGLCQCAEHALKFQAELSLRLATSSLRIVPDKRTPQNYDGTAHCWEQLPFMQGTHFAFQFELSSQ